MQKQVAKILVYLANIIEATSREIESGADLHQPEVSLAAKFLEEQGWVRHRQIPSDKAGPSGECVLFSATCYGDHSCDREAEVGGDKPAAGDGEEDEGVWYELKRNGGMRMNG